MQLSELGEKASLRGLFLVTTAPYKGKGDCNRRVQQVTPQRGVAEEV